MTRQAPWGPDMNSRQRRHDTSAARMRALQHAVEQTGKPGRIHGLTEACRDCTGGGTLHLLPGRVVVAEVHHDANCPAAAGVVDWKPAYGVHRSDCTVETVSEARAFASVVNAFGGLIARISTDDERKDITYNGRLRHRRIHPLTERNTT
jgi:hypothetical protein